jgi:anti-sigma factor RsiW
MKFKDVKILSEYLDGQLDPDILARVESRLSKDGYLRSVLEDLRSSRDLMRRLPMRKPKKDFHLRARWSPAIHRPQPARFPTGSGHGFLRFSCTFSKCVVTPLTLPAALHSLLAWKRRWDQSFAQEAPLPKKPSRQPSLGLEPLPTRNYSRKIAHGWRHTGI